MILISESCDRQRVSLKLELWSTLTGLLYRRICTISVNKAGICCFAFTHISLMQHFTANGFL